MVRGSLVVSELVDLTGRRFGRLVALHLAGSTKGRKARWACVCNCGLSVVVVGGNLLSGNTTSCGCVKREQTVAMFTKHGHNRQGKRTSEYESWAAMMARVSSGGHDRTRNHGARGIVVCDRWLSFELFLLDMGPRPEGKTLDRFPDNNGNYEPENCRWATNREQMRNQRRNHMITYREQTKCLIEWSEELNIPYKTILSRLRRGWDVDRAFNQPIRRARS